VTTTPRSSNNSSTSRRLRVEPEIPANRAADDDSRETLAVIERFRLLYRLILPPPFHQPDSAGERYATAQMAHLDSEKGGAH
jgi:hypothetical protein